MANRKKHERAKYLAKNTAIFTIGNIATKFITFFLVPLYTNALATYEYGIIDLVTTICSFLAPIIILNINESVMRFSLDKDADHMKILSIGVLIYVVSIILGLMIFPISKTFSSMANYSSYIYFYTVTLAGSQLLLCYLRGREKLIQYALGSVIQTLTLACLNIFFLVYINVGIAGYFLSMIISSIITMFYAILVGNVGSVVRNFKLDIGLMFQMIKYSVVLIPNTFMWWIMNASDRIMVTVMVGADVNGIYAISYKLPSLVSTFATIFNQAWSYSAIKEESSDDGSEFINRVLTLFTTFSMLVGIILLTFTKPFLKIYVADAYYDAWKYIPFLMIGCVYLTLGTFMATIYTVKKDSFGYLFSASFGAIFNIVLNYILIPIIGVYGAALATCVSYIAVFIFRAIHTRKYIKYKILTKEFVVGTILILLTSGFMYWENDSAFMVQILIAIFTICFYARNGMMIIKKILRKVRIFK